MAMQPESLKKSIFGQVFVLFILIEYDKTTVLRGKTMIMQRNKKTSYIIGIKIN